MTKKPLLDEEEEENVSKDNEIINIVDKEAIEALTNTLFLRISNERQSQFTKNPISSKEKNKVLESALLGNIQEDDFKDALWRIMGMRMRRNEGVSTDYDVYRLTRTFVIADQIVEERMPQERREHILRLCHYNSEKEQKMFKHEYFIIKYLQAKYPRRNHSVHFPALLDEGTLSELRYLNCLERSSHVREVTQQHRIPRPFFILEKLEPSLETVMNANKNAYMGVGTAVYLTIGCIKSMNTQFYALRLLHMKGICHRNVQPAHFALRLPPEGMLKRKESELCDLVAITDFFVCRKYRGNHSKLRKAFTYVGNWNYGSADTMAGKDSTSVDDLVSCIYMLTKFILGYVPWHLETEKQAIINCKKNVESWDYVEDELHNKLLVNNNKIYAILKRSNGFTIPVDYEELYAQLLHNVSNFPIDHSLFGFSNNLLEEYDNISAEKFRYERNNYEYHLPRRNKKSNAFKTKSANHSNNKSERCTGRAKRRVKIPIPSVTVNKKSVPMVTDSLESRIIKNYNSIAENITQENSKTENKLHR